MDWVFSADDTGVWIDDIVLLLALADVELLDLTVYLERVHGSVTVVRGPAT